jgi:hypothetical protein
MLIIPTDFINLIFFQGIQMSAFPSCPYGIHGVCYCSICMLCILYVVWISRIAAVVYDGKRKMTCLWLLTCVNVLKLLLLNIMAGEEYGSLLMTAKLSSNQHTRNLLPHCNWKKDSKCISESKWCKIWLWWNCWTQCNGTTVDICRNWVWNVRYHYANLFG